METNYILSMSQFKKKKLKKSPWDWEQEDYLLEGGARVCDPNKKLNKWEEIMYNFYRNVHF